MTQFSSRKVLSAIFAVLVLFAAFYLRSTGLYDNFHTDEQAIMSPVENMSKTYSLDPNYYERPNHVSIYLNFVIQNAYSLVRYHELLARSYDAHTAEYFAVARTVNALIGTAMILIAFLIGLEFSKRLAIIFGLLFAFFPIFVEHSHLITPDIPTALLTLVMILLSIRLVKQFSKKRLPLLCFFCALNIIEKYPGLISIVLVFFAIAIRQYTQDGKIDIKRLVVSWIKYGLLVVLFCYLLSPSLFIHPKQTLKNLFQETGGHIGADGLGFTGNVLFYARTFFVSVGLLSSAFFGFWLFSAIKSRSMQRVPLYYGFFYCVMMSFLGLHWVRWGMPMYVSPLFCIGLGFDYLLGSRYLKVPAIVVFSILMANNAICSLYTTVDYHLVSTVNSSKEFAQINSITPENTIYEGYTTFYEYRTKGIDWFEKKDNAQYKYVLVSSGMMDRFRQNPQRDPERIRAYDEIEKLELLRVFKPTEKPGISLFEYRNFSQLPVYVYSVLKDGYKDYFKGPTIWFYKAR